MGIVLAAFALTGMLPTAALALENRDDLPDEASFAEPASAESSARESFTLGLEIQNADAERPMLSLRGTRTNPGNFGPFKVNAHIARIPCPGQYLFSAAQENTRNGNSSTYDGLLRLYDPEARPASVRCGASPPRRAGEVEVTLSVLERKIFDLKADRSNGGPFSGTLTFKVFPQCDTDYELRTALDLDGWRRSVDYKVEVLEFEATFQGRKVPKQQC